jgi:MarR-like DNA-binding transcriptional regulator SgrR of sgrS sRNA
VLATLAIPLMARTRPHYGGTLRVETAGDAWDRQSGFARRLVYDGLTQLDANEAVRSALGVTWEADSTHHRWQFRLRAGVHFQDGTALTSIAVAASLASSCSTDCPWTSVRAVGPMVVFTSDNPMPNLPALLAGDQFLIGLTATSEGKTPGNSIGTGPFQVNGFNNGILTLTANENCWSGRPFADAIEIRVHRTVRDQWLDLSMGRADVVEVPAEQLRQAQQEKMNLLISPPLTLLALEVSDSGALANLKLRGAIAAAVDRSALFNVIFQKQGAVTASLLPQQVSGYAFLFPADRDLNKAHELRGGLGTGQLTLGTDGDGTMQLAAQRIALNLHEAGFNVQVVNAAAQHPDLSLRKLQISADDPAAAMEQVLSTASGVYTPVAAESPSALFKAESTALDEKRVIPMLDLPRAYASGPRVRDLRLRADGSPDLANTSLEDAR